MGILRVIWRLPALVLAIGGHLVWLAGARTAARWRKEKDLHREMRLVKSCARMVGRIFGMRVNVEGPIPEGRFLLVLNHLSYVDVVLVLSVVNLRFLSKAEVASWPFVGLMTRMMGTLFVDRTRRADLPRVIIEIESTMDSGCGVAFFPEGTSSPGARVLPFKPSIFEVAASGGLELTCAAISYRTEPPAPPAELSVCWWGDMSFGLHLLRLMALPGFDARLVFGAEKVVARDRKVLAAEAREAVARLFTPVCSVDPSEEAVEVLAG